MRVFIAAVVACVVLTTDFELSHTPSVSTHVGAARVGNENEIVSIERANPDRSLSFPAIPTPTNRLSVASATEDEIPVSEVVLEANKSFCDALKEAAESSDIPVAFFARLLWQESRFQSLEVSPVGAQGVAQFMPSTAAEVGLDDPFDPFKALPASAKFLRKLRNEFGNLGLAAAAYNAGSGRIQKWLSRQGGLPRETRDYVRTITGNIAENWLEESKTISLRLELPRGAPCEGVGGLSKTKEVAAMSVALAPSVSGMIRRAEAEALRAAAAKLKAAKGKLSLKMRKAPVKHPPGIREAGKTPGRSRTKTAERSRQLKVASAIR
jgi:hypothetical protein